MGYFLTGIICLMAGAGIGIIVGCLVKGNKGIDKVRAIAKEKDYWHREAIKNTAKLGEIRIAIAMQSKQAEA